MKRLLVYAMPYGKHNTAVDIFLFRSDMSCRRKRSLTTSSFEGHAMPRFDDKGYSLEESLSNCKDFEGRKDLNFTRNGVGSTLHLTNRHTARKRTELNNPCHAESRNKRAQRALTRL